MNPKQRAAEAAIAFVQSGMVVGLGTGSTADEFLKVLADAIQSGRLRDIRGVPTSRQSERRAQQLGIPLALLGYCARPDVTIDGADEVAPNLDLIKGLGGALLREKIVAQNSRQLVIIADHTKRVARLGARSPLPVEVIPFCHEVHVPFLTGLGCRPVLRRNEADEIFATDSGNYIYDCHFDRIDNAAVLEATLLHRAGIVDSGLFLGMATCALIADDATVDRLDR